MTVVSHVLPRFRSRCATALAIALTTVVAFSSCGGEDGSTLPSTVGDGTGSSGGGGGGSTRVYQGFDTTFAQTSADTGNVSAELTIDSTSGTVSLTSAGGALSSSITPGYEAFGYQPLTTAGWYLFEAPGALAILVKHPTGGLQQAQIDRIYVGLLKSELACPSAGKSYGLSYGLRLANGTPFGGYNAGAQFVYKDPSYSHGSCVACSTIFTFGLAGTFPSYTGKQSVTAEFEMFSDDLCSGSGVYYGRNGAIVNALLGNTNMVGAYDNNSSGFRTSVFVGNSATLSSIAGYAGTYDGVVVNDPNGSTWKTGVTIDSSGNLGGSTLVTGGTPVLRLLGASSNQLILTAGSGGTAEEWLVTPVQSGTAIALWGTKSTSNITTGDDQFVFLVKRP